MSQHVYAFGSICRDDFSRDSDIDLLAIVDGFKSRFDPALFSIYSYRRIIALWQCGNPFAWHLALESRLVYASNGEDFLRSLGEPAPYQNWDKDCHKFQLLFLDALSAMHESRETRLFDLSTIFLSIRNFATCYLLGARGIPDFSRNVARRMGEASVPLSEEGFGILSRARTLCVRGIGDYIDEDDCNRVFAQLPAVSDWMAGLLVARSEDVRIQ